FTQQGDSRKNLLNLFPEDPLSFLKVDGDASILKELIDGLIVAASNIPQFVVAEPVLPRYRRFTGLQQPVRNAAHRRNHTNRLPVAHRMHDAAGLIDLGSPPNGRTTKLNHYHAK